MCTILFFVAIGLQIFVAALALPQNRNEANLDWNKKENGIRIEGDMILTEEQLDDLYSPVRVGKIDKKFLWPKGIVPYAMSPRHSQKQIEYIKKAFEKIESVSCIKFVPRVNEIGYLQINAAEGDCSSKVGYSSWKQTMNLEPKSIGTGCFKMGAILHELLHVLGFYHMQNAYDRDDFITINWDNVLPSEKENFVKYFDVSHFGETYDYTSVMHYGTLPRGDKLTIEPLDKNYLNVIGQLIGLSRKDILKLNKMYECNMTNLVMPPETETIEHLSEIPDGRFQSFYKKIDLIQYIIGLQHFGFLDSALTPEELEDTDIPGLIDLIIKGLKTNLERHPEQAYLLQPQIDRYEEKKKYS